MTSNSNTGTTFIAVGSLAGAGVSSAVGGIGLVGSFGGVGIGASPVIGAGAAVYGAVRGIAEGDAAAFGAIWAGSFASVK
ncbi:MAG TPA: hypothetical protein VK203_24775 [Nostocaceae cyanobacterium]|nr:hypothetical protein [Nostocaceae cyanobacterium]